MIPELARLEILQDALAGFELQVSADISAHRIAEDHIEREYPGSVVSATQSECGMRQVQISEVLYDIQREVRGKSAVVERVDQQGFFAGTRQLFEIGPGTDRHPDLAQIFQRDKALQSLSHMPRGNPLPDHIRKIGRDVILDA